MAYNPSDESEFVISVADWGNFQRNSALEVGGDSRVSFDGGSDDGYVKGGKATAKEFTVGRAFDKGRDVRLSKKYLPLVNRVYLQVSLYPTDQELQREGEYYTARCLLTKLMLPASTNANREGAGADAMIELTFRPARWVVQS